MALSKRVRDGLAALRIERYLEVMSQAERYQLELAREAHPGPGNTEDPLVSITIPTFNRADLLTQRCLPSVLSQTYQKLEVVVVGDHCTDKTAEKLAELHDDRIRFINLPAPSNYPEPGLDRWRVAGSVPINRALFEARGQWLAYMDDDDEMLPHRLEHSLELARKTGAELVCGCVAVEEASGTWRTEGGGPWPTGRRPFRPARVPHSAAVYRSYLRFLLYDSKSYRVGLPTDRNWVYRLARAGVRAVMFQELMTRVPLRPTGTQTSGGPGNRP